MSTIPFVPLLWPVILHLFADSPDADLIWVPLLAFSWMIYTLRSNRKPYQDDEELNILLGLTASVIVIVSMAIGRHAYPLTFWNTGEALLLWPVWTLAVTWQMFGVGVTKLIWKPLVYLLLTSPLLLAGWMTPLHNLLVHFLQVSLGSVHHVVPWVSFDNQTGQVEHAGHWLSVSISSACLGSDSVVALIIVAPLLFVFYQGPHWRKWGLLGTGILIAICLNFLRIIVLLAVLHIAGEGSVFDDTHAIIGSILFAGLSLLLAAVAHGVGLRFQPSERNPESRYLKLPAKRHLIWLTLFALPIAGMVYASAWHNQSGIWNPLELKSSPDVTVPPTIGDYKRVFIGTYDDSATLGQGAHSVAYAYSNPSGLYHRVEVWKGLSPWRLQAYGIRDCLTFHGDKVLGETTFTPTEGLTGTSYTVQIPPLTMGGQVAIYQVIAYTFAAKADGTTGYYRIEISTPMAKNEVLHAPDNQKLATAISRAWKSMSGQLALPNEEKLQIQGTKTFANAFTNEFLQVNLVN